MTASEMRNRALDGDFLAKLAATLCLVGQDILAESGATANHAERLAYAYVCFGDAEGQARKMAFALATVAAISAVPVGPVPDATLKSVVTAAWDVLRQVP